MTAACFSRDLDRGRADFAALHPSGRFDRPRYDLAAAVEGIEAARVATPFAHLDDAVTAAERRPE